MLCDHFVDSFELLELLLGVECYGHFESLARGSLNFQGHVDQPALLITSFIILNLLKLLRHY